MRVLGDSWCFCNGGGGGKSEKMKASIYSGKGGAMATINGGGTGFLIHRNLLLTTHANLPSVSSAEAAEIRLHNGLSATLFPHRFFITSSVLDLTMVGLDTLEGETNTAQPHYLKTSSKSNLELGSTVYLLGHTTEKQELTVGEGKVVIATDNLIKLSTDEITYSPGSAGFDVHGNLSFMVCDPMKLSTSPNPKSSSTSSSSSKKDIPMQFGIPITVICDWLNQNWEGNLDELNNKPRLPLMRLMSASGHKSEHSCASFTMRRVFKTIEGENEVSTPTSSNVIISRPTEQPGSSLTIVNASRDRDSSKSAGPQGSTHPQGIPTPEIYESPLLNSIPLKKKNATTTQIQLLDINFPPRITKPVLSSPKQQSKEVLPNTDQNYIKNLLLQEPNKKKHGDDDLERSEPVPDAESTGSFNGAEEKIQSSHSHVDMSEEQHEYSSEGETMYSAETAESRNIPIVPKQNGRLYQVGRSQSCVNYSNRWGPLQRNTVARGATLEKHASFGTRGRKVYSQGANSQRSNDYFSPTVSSVMKKRNNLLEQHTRPRLSAVHSSPKWNF